VVANKEPPDRQPNEWKDAFNDHHLLPAVCAEKPCREACPADCSPADFIMAAKVGAPSDFRRAAAHIMAANPLGGVCGVVCPDTHCMRACARATFDVPVNIPAVQATIIAKARELGVMPALDKPN
jgi:NADPH-dependent glutamate synthase beta subunit-like oxidoreductase